MATPPVGPYARIPEADAYTITGTDMTILREALNLKSDNERLRREIVSLRQIIERLEAEAHAA